MNKPKLSVIVPVYNTKDYVLRAINSILNQTYKNIEIIIVDDASDDGSKKVINNLNDKRIKKFFLDSHMGTAYARNLAIKNSSGDYIGSIDSDDYIDPDYYENIMNKMIKEECDLGLCDILCVYEDKNGNNTLINGCDGKKTKLNIISNGMVASSCNKVIKKELLTSFPYPEGFMNEDVATIIPAIVKSKKIAYVPESVYNYVQRKNSTQNKEFSSKRFDIFPILDITFERIKDDKKFLEYQDAIIYHQVIALVLYVLPKISSSYRRRFYIKEFRRRCNYSLINNKYVLEFLSHESKKNQLYYKLYLTFIDKKMYFLANMLVNALNVYKKNFRRSVIKKNITLNTLISCAKKQAKKKSDIKVSVVIPNYNYENYLYQRIYSILNQTEKVDELILLDDCSTDHSRELLDLITIKLSPYIRIIKDYNVTNSGSPFKQWEKGMKHATKEYVWIAEADDYCDKTMLAKLKKQIRSDKDIRLAYVNTAYINNEGNIILKSIVPEIDIQKTGHYDHSFIIDGKEEYRNYAYLNCTIANVSSVLFKKDNYKEFFLQSSKYRQAGDYLFYLNVMQLGKVSYVSDALNYYRVHGNNVTSTTKKENFIKELEEIHKYCEKKYGLTKKQKKNIMDRLKFLKKVWKLG